MFAGIAGRYDLANRFLSAGCDLWWRRVLVRRVKAAHPARVADLATGSGDVALALRRALPPEAVVEGLDFCEPMLAIARAKAARHPVTAALPFRLGDCLHLPLPDATVDVVTIAFGLRNLESRADGLREMLRVLRPGGCLLVLEFTQPDAWLRPFYFFYLRRILPLLAALLTGDRGAYEYLAGSVEAFPSRDLLAAEIAAAGFSRVHATGLTGGIVALHQAWK